MATPAPEKPESMFWLVLTTAISVALLIVVCATGECSSEVSARDCPDTQFRNLSRKDLEFYVCGAARKIVEGRLKAPSTASFLPGKVAWNSHDRWLVRVSVDAENSFGARLRFHYLVALRVNPSDASKYFHSPSRAILEIDGPKPTAIELRAARIANEWED